MQIKCILSMHQNRRKNNTSERSDNMLTLNYNISDENIREIANYNKR